MPSARAYLRPPGPGDEREFLARARASTALHAPWTRAPSTPAAYQALLEKMSQPQHCGFLVCRREDDAIAGWMEITQIVLGPLRSGYVGYYAFSGFERQGLMRDGLRALVRHAFCTLKLHRLEANIQPHNAASLALAASCGFRQEGYSPRYLKIRGRWRDHERWAILAS